jgi:hypothetical protein
MVIYRYMGYIYVRYIDNNISTIKNLVRESEK